MEQLIENSCEHVVYAILEEIVFPVSKYLFVRHIDEAPRCMP